MGSLICRWFFLALLFTAKASTGDTGAHSDRSDLISTEHEVLPVPLMPGADRPWTGDAELIQTTPVLGPYHVFPMFQHVPVPLVDKELFRPASRKKHFPNILSSLLIPRARPRRLQVSPVRNARGVEVWCGYSKISVRVNKKLLGFRSSPSLFYLGTCCASRHDSSFIYFHYDLKECGSTLTMMNGQIIYSNTVRYIPEPQRSVIRAVPLSLNIQCQYNRFHYSYKMGFLPVMREHVSHKTFESRVKFTVSVCNERWEILQDNESVVLGEPMYFEVSAAHVSRKERIFVDSCYATVSKDPNSTPQHSVIHHFGCMEDSRRHGSLSRFLQRQSNFIRFSVDAFLLPQVTDTSLYLHCKVSVHNTTTRATAKSCTYNSVKMRWEELETDAPVCACCETVCEAEATTSSPHARRSLITSTAWILNETPQPSIHRDGGWVSALGDRKEVKRAQEIKDYTEEIVTDAEEQMKAKHRNNEMLTNDADGKVEVLVDTDATFTEFQERVAGPSGDVMFLGEQMEERVAADPGAFESTVKTQRVIDEEMFLNAKQEPGDWNKDT